MPPAVLTNADLATFLDTNDEWITSRTGIRERRVSHVPLEELGYVAAMRALACAGPRPGGRRADRVRHLQLRRPGAEPGVRPAGAPRRQEGRVDGRQHGLHQLPVRAQHGQRPDPHRRGAQRASWSAASSSAPSWTGDNRGVSVLFGDGCAAVVLQATDREEGLLAERLGCDSDARHTLVVEGMGTRYADYTRCYGDTHWIFEGQEIFKRAVIGMSGACADVLASRHLTPDDIRPGRAAPGQPAHHRGGRQARGRADGARVRQRAPLRQHVRGHGAGGAGRGARGRTRAAEQPAAAAGLRRRPDLVRPPRALGRPRHAARAPPTSTCRPATRLRSRWCRSSGAGRPRTRTAAEVAGRRPTGATHSARGAAHVAAGRAQGAAADPLLRAAVGLHGHPRQADQPARARAGLVAHADRGGRAAGVAPVVARAAGRRKPHARGLRRHRRDRGAALAHFLRRDQAGQRVGGRELHGGGAAVPGGHRTVDRAAAVRFARTGRRCGRAARSRVGGRGHAGRHAPRPGGRRAVGAAGRDLRRAQQALRRARQSVAGHRRRTRGRHGVPDRGGAAVARRTALALAARAARRAAARGAVARLHAAAVRAGAACAAPHQLPSRRSSR